MRSRRPGPSRVNAALSQADPSSDLAGRLSPLPCLVCAFNPHPSKYRIKSINPGHGPGAAVRFPGPLRRAHALPGRGTALPPSRDGSRAAAEGARGETAPGRAGGPATGDSLSATGGQAADSLAFLLPGWGAALPGRLRGLRLPPPPPPPPEVPPAAVSNSQAPRRGKRQPGGLCGGQSGEGEVDLGLVEGNTESLQGFNL